MESSATSDSDAPVVLTPSQVRHELRSVSRNVRRLSRAFDMHEERLTRLEQQPDSLDAAALTSTAAPAVAHASGAAPVGLSDSPGARTRPSPPVTRSAARAHEAAIVATPRPSSGPLGAARGARTRSKTSAITSGSKSASRRATRGTDSRPVATAARSPASTRQTTPDGGPVSLSTHSAATTGAAAIAAGSSTASVTQGPRRSTLPDTSSTSSSPVASTSVSRTRTVAKEKARALPDELPMLPRRSKYRTVETTASPLENMQRHQIAVASTSIRQHRGSPSIDSSSEQMLRTPSPPRESADELYDESGAPISPARVLELFARFAFLSLDTFPIVYKHIFGCPPIRPGVSLESFRSDLGSLEGFKLISIWNSGTIRVFLHCVGPQLEERKASLLSRLQLEDEHIPAVPAPLLCSLLGAMACMHVGHMTGDTLGQLFYRVTGYNLTSIRVATGSGVTTKTLDEICGLVKEWLRDFHLAIVEGDVMDESLIMASACNRSYLNTCRRNGYTGGVMDADGVVANEMLASNKSFSRTFLGIRASELKMLFKYSGCMLHGAL